MSAQLRLPVGRDTWAVVEVGGAAVAPAIVCSETWSGVESPLNWYTLVQKSMSLQLILSIISMTVLNGDGGVPSLLASLTFAGRLVFGLVGALLRGGVRKWELCSAWERTADGSGLCPSPLGPAPRNSWRTASSKTEV